MPATRQTDPDARPAGRRPTAERRAGWVGAAGPTGPAVTGTRATVRAGHQAAAVAVSHGQQHARADQPPRQVEAVDAVAGGRLQPWPRRRSSRPGRRRSRPRRRRRRRRRRWPASPGAGAGRWRRSRRACRAGAAGAGRRRRSRRRRPATTSSRTDRGQRRARHRGGGRLLGLVGVRQSSPRGRRRRLEPAAEASATRSPAGGRRRGWSPTAAARRRAGRRRANSSFRSPGFSTRPTTVRSAPSRVERAADADVERRRPPRR